MTGKLLDLKVSELLVKFGAGSHKPGSGSAAALQGILAAQLIRTVIELTKDPKRKHHYSEHLPKLLHAEFEIDRKVLPHLQNLFEDDSEHFDKVIILRKKRDAEKYLPTKKALGEEALNLLKRATEIPIQIATECASLGKFAVLTFDHGFSSARGDSGVALNAALAGLTGSLSIVELNLLSFHPNEWTEEVRSARDALVIELEELQSKSRDRLYKQKRQSDKSARFFQELSAIKKSARNGTFFSTTQIEKVAVRLQKAMWGNRELIWNNRAPESPFEILRPTMALKCYGFQIEHLTTLGQHTVHGKEVEVAGQINQQDRFVSISSQFPSEVQNFTAAHELGHSLLHTQHVMHRDRPLDGSVHQEQRSGDEWQADKFATYFLMPRELVRKTFLTMFLSVPFKISEETAFALNEGTSDMLREKSATLRGLSRLLADSTLYNGVNFVSISKQFGVSTGAMAIRMEELGLVAFPLPTTKRMRS